MPTMIRPDKKATKIVYSILGTPPNMVGAKKKPKKNNLKKPPLPEEYSKDR